MEKIVGKIKKWISKETEQLFWMTLIIGSCVSSFLYYQIYQAEELKFHQTLITFSTNRINALERNLSTLTNQLELVKSIFEVFPSLTREEFANFVHPILTKKGGILAVEWVPLIKIKTLKVRDQFEIHIYDNGMGIPESIQNKMFSPFFTSKPTGEGLGLGLSLSYEIIVHEHKGTMNFKSNEGEFAEFIISLPLKISS